MNSIPKRVGDVIFCHEIIWTTIYDINLAFVNLKWIIPVSLDKGSEFQYPFVRAFYWKFLELWLNQCNPSKNVKIRTVQSS